MNPADRAPETIGQGEPAWEIAHLFPNQGQWSEEEYLELNGNRLVEFSHGCLEVLTMPTMSHQLVVGCLYRALSAFVESGRLGLVLMAPLRVRLWEGKIREPDIVFMLTANASRMGETYWDRADMVMEVVSTDDRRRDLDTKRREYAQAGIPEYWIVDPLNSQVTVLRLDADRYVVHGLFSAGELAVSALLPDFSIDVSAVFAPRR